MENDKAKATDDSVKESPDNSSPPAATSAYDDMFGDRYTDQDEEYIKVLNSPADPVPCVERWYAKNNRQQNWNRNDRHNQRPYDRRDNRGGGNYGNRYHDNRHGGYQQHRDGGYSHRGHGGGGGGGGYRRGGGGYGSGYDRY